MPIESIVPAALARLFKPLVSHAPNTHSTEATTATAFANTRAFGTGVSLNREVFVAHVTRR